jgi:hypothetical protein
MDRREFLIRGGSALLVLPLGTFLVRCSSSDNGVTTSSPSPTEPDQTPPDAPPRVVGENVVYTSNQVNAHSHSFSVPTGAIANPPAAGISGNTTTAQLHEHSLVLTQADLQAASSGQTVKVSTGNTLGHTHVFTIVKVT